MSNESTSEVLVEGGYGGRINVNKGQVLSIVNVDGKQVCDFFAFNRDNVREALSPGHQRSVLRRTFLKTGDTLYTVLRRPMFELLEDTVGQNDFSLPACDPERYKMDFNVDNHRSCRKNLEEAMADNDIPYEYLPDPFNFFQPTPVKADGTYGTGTSPSRPDDRIILRALMDVVAVASSCPQDQIALNDFNPSRLRMLVSNG